MARLIRPKVHAFLERILNHKIIRLPTNSWLIVPQRGASALAVQASYNLRPPTGIHYVFNSCAAGILSLHLKYESGESIVKLSEPISMPCEWSLELNDHVSLNGRVVSQGPIELRDIAWMISELNFASSDGKRLSRLLRHRLLGKFVGIGQDYYNGNNYKNYDGEKTSYGIDILNRLQRHGTIDSLLDVGCATGILLQHAQAQGIKVAG